MKKPIFFAIIAFFLGVALFGIFKSLALLKSNIELTHKVGLLTMDLDITQTSLDKTKVALSDSYLKSAQLEGELKHIEIELVKKEKEVKGLLGNISKLSHELKKASDSIEDLSGANKELRDRSLRIELENSEMKQRFSSIQELKLAIKELKIKMREERQRKPKQHAPKASSPQTEKESRQLVPKLPSLNNKMAEGNLGFFIKDGKSTFEGIVNIEVVPVEERGL